MRTFASTPVIILLLAVVWLSGCRKNSDFLEIGFETQGGVTDGMADYTLNSDGGVYRTENSTTTFIKNIGK
jgi:hypothetical protein